MPSNVQPVPEGYHTVTPYLVVPDAARMIEFLTNAFNAEERFRHTDDAGRIAHTELKIGDSMVMMGQASGPWKPTQTMLYVYLPDVDAVYQRAVAAGGSSIQEPANQYYGDRRAGVADPAGNQWFIATHFEDVSMEEMKRRQEAAQVKA